MTARQEHMAQGFYAEKQIYLKDWLISWSHRRRFETGIQLVTEPQPKRLPDYGCGDGTFLALLAQSAPKLGEATGCELLGTVVSELQQRLGPVSRLAFRLVRDIDDEGFYGRYDVVTCMEVLEHVVDTAEVINRLDRLLAPGGRLIVSVPIETGPAVVLKQAARRIAGWRGLEYYQHVARYSWPELFSSLAAGNKQHIPRFVYDDPNGGKFYDHKGFNWRVLHCNLERVFRTERILYSPLAWLPQLASQVWLVLRKRDFAA